jgi:hypothetical protein
MIRVVENERDGVIVCPNAVADKPVNVSDATYATPGFGAFGESGFVGEGRVRRARPFTLSSFV